MTNGEREKRESVVAVVDGSDVLVVAGPAGPSLPQLDDGFPSPAQVFDAAGVGPEFAVIAAPTRHVDGTPAQIVHLVAVGSRPHGTDWVPVDRLAASAEIREVIRRGTDEWTGRRPRPPNRPNWYVPGWSTEADSWIDERLADLGRRRTGRPSR